MNPLRILLLEDSLLDAELAQASLVEGDLDCEVVRVETRGDFIAALQSAAFDLILADYALPAFDGITALGIAQSLCPDIPFIFVSATLGEELAIEALKKGATDYVLKQRLGRLVPSVQRALREAKARSDRQQAEDNLRLALQELTFHIDNSPLAVLEWDQDFRVSRWSSQAEKIFGWTAKEVLGLHLTEWAFIFHEDVEAVTEGLNQLLASGTRQSQSTNRNYRKDGSVIYCEWYSSVLVDEAGALISIQSRVLDITDRILSERALRESEARFKRLVESNIIGCMFWTQPGDITDANDAFLHMVGYTRADLETGKLNWRAMTPPEQLCLSDRAIGQMQVTGNAYPMEKEYIRKDGSRVPVILGGVMLEGYIDRGVSFVLDMSEAKARERDRKQAEAEIRQREQQFRTLAENSPDIIARVGRDHRYLYISPAIQQAVDRSPADFLGKTTPELGFPSDLTELLQTKGEEIFATGQERRIEFTFPSTGAIRYYQARLVPEFAPDGTVESILGITRDITDYKQAEESLRHNEARFRRVFESDMIGMGFWNEAGQVTDVNDAYLNLIGYSRADWVAGVIPWASLTPPEYAALDIQKDREVRETGYFTPYEKEYILKNGDRIFVLIGAARFGSTLAGGVFFALDLSEIKQLEHQLRRQTEALERASRVKDEFLAVLSHELRSPLNAILGWAQMLRTRNYNEATTIRALETIERNARLQTQLIEDLLDISRIIQGKLTLNLGSVNLFTTVEGAIETMRLSAEAKSIHLQTDFDRRIGLITGDANRLQQVICNLLSNAIKFTPHGGRVEVYLSQVEPEAGGLPGNLASAQIQIKDNGKGINKAFLPHVFEHFRQADSSITRTYGGLGLGLAIVRQLVELHGGRVRAESPGEGQGATFTVLLPIKAREPMSFTLLPSRTAAPQSVSSPAADRLSHCRILVVDDEVDARQFLALLLEQEGAAVMVVASAAEVYRAIKQFHPNLLISDVGMPEEDGYTMLRKLRSRERAAGSLLKLKQQGPLPAIALTAYAQEKDYSQAIAAGFQAHLSKPVDATQLLTTILSLVSPRERSGDPAPAPQPVAADRSAENS